MQGRWRRSRRCVDPLVFKKGKKRRLAKRCKNEAIDTQGLGSEVAQRRKEEGEGKENNGACEGSSRAVCCFAAVSVSLFGALKIFLFVDGCSR